MNTYTRITLSLPLLLLSIGCVNREEQKQAKRTEAIVSDSTRAVATELVTRANLVRTLTISGTITTSQDVQISAKNPGRLVSVYVRDGDPVRAGQVIASQDLSDQLNLLRQASASVATARASLSQALANLRQGPIKSAASVKSAEALVAQAKAQLRKAQAGPREEERKQTDAQVQAAKSNLDTSKADLDRKRQLFEEGAISRQTLDVAENAYQNALSQYQSALQLQAMMQNWTRPEDLEIAREAVRSAEQNLTQAKAEQKLDVILKDQVDAARSNLQSAVAAEALRRQALSDAQLRSPFEGKISGKVTPVGTFLSSGMPVARVVGKEGVYFEGQLPESSVAEVSIGRLVRVRVPALGNKSLNGKVVAVSPSGDNIGRQFNARIRILGSFGEIRPGMFAEGVVDVEELPNRVVAPTTAIVESGGKSYVFVVEAGKAKRIEIKTGIQNGNMTEVSGVTVGTPVIVKGQSGLNDGSAVQVQNAQASRKPASDQ